MALFFRFDLWRNRSKQWSSILGLYAAITPTGAAQHLRPYCQILICAYVCVCVCMHPIYKCLPLFVSESARFFFKVSGEQRVAAVNKNHRRSKTLFTSEGSMGRCRGQPSSEEDSPSYKRGPFSQWWANETDSLFVCVCVFCLYLHATLPRWNKDSMDSFLVSRLLNFFYVILNWGIRISCGYVCVFCFFFAFSCGEDQMETFESCWFVKKKRKKRHSDTPEFNWSTLKGNKNKDKTLDFPFDEP